MVPSDRLLISGNATATTGILINDTNTASGSYNPVGITLVAVNGASTNAFFLQGVSSNDELQSGRGPMGAIKKGFWFYPLLQTTHAVALADGLTGANSTEYRLYGLPDAEVFQLPLAITGAENTWYETALGWNERQEEVRKYWSNIYERVGTDSSGEPGLWMKVTGSWGDRTITHSLAGYAPGSSVLPDINTSFNQDTYSVQVGADTGITQVFDKDDVLVLGGSVGYVNSNVDFKTSPNSFGYSGATLGVSADYMNGGFFLDGLLKADLMRLSLNFNSLTYFGYNNQGINAYSWGVLANAGYHFNLGGGNAVGLDQVYLEPVLTVAYTQSNLDNFSALGTSAKFNLGETFRGAIGGRLGGLLSEGDSYFLDGSLTGKYWQEFTNNTSLTVYSLGPQLPMDDMAQEKGFGEVTGMLNFAGKDTGWSVNLNGGAKFNSQFTTLEARGGVRYQW